MPSVLLTMSASSQILLPSSEAIFGYYLQWQRQIHYIERNRRPALLLIICRELNRSRLSSFSNTMPNLAGLSSTQLKKNFSDLSSASSLSVKCLDMRVLNQMDQKNYFLCFYSQVVNKEFKIMIEINHVTRYSVGAKGNSRGISKVPDGNDPKTSYDYLYLSLYLHIALLQTAGYKPARPEKQ